VLSVFLAWRGFQAYSFILPLPIVALVRAAALWHFAVPHIGWRISMRRWRFLWGDNVILLAATFLYTITSHGDYLILGRLFPEEVVGQYFWAFSLSTQTLQALAISVGGILLPSLSLLQREPERQLGAFLRAAKALAALAVPGCLLQAALADSLVRLLFAPRWYSAIPVLQVLSAGWSVFVVIYSSGSLMKATGRFLAYFWCGLGSAIAFVMLVYWGATVGEAVGAAVGVAAFAILLGPGSLYISIRPLGGTARATIAVFSVPIIASALSVGTGWICAQLVPVIPGQHAIRLLMITSITVCLYVPLLRALAPDTWMELRAKLRGILQGPRVAVNDSASSKR
jgi:O-antigen/teichoic acid export membrane protein